MKRIFNSIKTNLNVKKIHLSRVNFMTINKPKSIFIFKGNMRRIPSFTFSSQIKTLNNMELQAILDSLPQENLDLTKPIGDNTQKDFDLEGNLIEYNDTSKWEEVVLQSKIPVIVDCYAK